MMIIVDINLNLQNYSYTRKDLNQMIIEILEIIGAFIGITAIIIVIWDHFKDDRLLYRQVQVFYEDIEKLIYTYYNIYKSKISKNQTPIENPKQQNTYYDCRVKQNFDKYSNYLGLTRLEELDFYYYYNNTDIILKNTGELYRDYGDEKEQALDGFQIDIKDVNVINEYLNMLREYWKKSYSKPFFRPILKQKIDFSIIIE